MVSECYEKINHSNFEWLCGKELPPSEGLMCLAIRYDNEQLQNKMADLGIAFNCTDSLFAAIHAHRPRNVERILKLGYDLEEIFEGKRLLDVAYLTGNETIVGMLYDYGAMASPDIEIEDVGGSAVNLDDLHGFLMTLLNGNMH